MKPRVSQLGQSGATTGQGLVWNGSEWAPATASGSGIPATLLDAKGDLIVASANDTAARLAVGTNGQVLTADSAQALGVAWATPATSGGASAFPSSLDQTTLHATAGDEFTGTALNARWARRGIVAGDETFQAEGGGRGLYVRSLSDGEMYLQSAPAGDFTVDLSVSLLSSMPTSGVTLIGPVIVDSTGAGVASGFRGFDGGYWAFSLAAYVFAAYGTAGVGLAGIVDMDFASAWMRLTRVGTSYTAKFSRNGWAWSRATPALTWAGTPDRIGFGCGFTNNAAGDNDVLARRFNVV